MRPVAFHASTRAVLLVTLIALYVAADPARAAQVSVDEGVSIESMGSAVSRIHLREARTISSLDFVLEPEGDAIAFALLSSRNCSAQRALCPVATILRIPQLIDRFHNGQFVDATEEPISPGDYDVLIVADGPVVLDMFRTPGHEPHTQRATTPIDAAITALPSRCEAGPVCRTLSFGGMTHEVAGRGFAMSIAYAGIDADMSTTDTGAYGASACISPESSETMRQYSHGCTDASTLAQEDDAVPTTQLSLVGRGWVLATEINPRASGPVYAGYTIHGSEPGPAGAYGVWVSALPS